MERFITPTIYPITIENILCKTILLCKKINIIEHI